MKKLITTVILLAGITLNVFAQQEIPMFFDSDLGLQSRFYSTKEVTYSFDGSKIAIVSNVDGKKIVIYDAVNERELHKLTGHSKEAFGIIFSPNGRQLASFAYDSTIKIQDVTNGQLIRTIQADVDAITFSPDGNYILGADGRSYDIIYWNIATGNEQRRLSGHTNIVWSIIYSPDGRQIATASDDKSIKIWDAASGRILRTINNEKPFFNVIFSPNGQNIAAYTYDPSGRRDGDYFIKIYNVGNGQEIKNFQVIPDSYMAYSPDSRQLMYNVYDSSGNIVIKIIDPETGREMHSYNNNNRIIAFSSDGRRILTISSSFQLQLDNVSYGASYANILDATTGRNIGVIGYGPLNIGAKAFADLQIARFLNDTAAVSRNEAILNFITGRGDATRAEIEAFYRNNVRAQIEGVVDRELITGKSVNNDTRRVINEIVTTPLTNFYLSPTQTNFDRLKRNHTVLGQIINFTGFNYSTSTSMANLRRQGELGEIYHSSIAGGLLDFTGIQRLQMQMDMMNRRNIAQALNQVITEMRQYQARTASQEFGISNTNNVEWEKILLYSVINALNVDLARMVRQ